MDRIINLEVLGHPVNWAIILGMIVLIWFGLYVLANRTGFTLSDKPTSEG